MAFAPVQAMGEINYGNYADQVSWPASPSTHGRHRRVLGPGDPLVRQPRRARGLRPGLGALGMAAVDVLVLPVMGPSAARDGVGLLPDALLDPAFYVFPASFVFTFDEQVESIDTYQNLTASSFDVYDDARLLWIAARPHAAPALNARPCRYAPVRASAAPTGTPGGCLPREPGNVVDSAGSASR